MALPCPKTTHNHNFEISEIEGGGGGRQRKKNLYPLSRFLKLIEVKLQATCLINIIFSQHAIPVLREVRTLFILVFLGRLRH